MAYIIYVMLREVTVRCYKSIISSASFDGEIFEKIMIVSLYARLKIVSKKRRNTYVEFCLSSQSQSVVDRSEFLVSPTDRC